MTTMTHETEITADDKVPVIRITREFDAPPGEGVPGARRPRAARPVARPTRSGDDDRLLRLSHRGRLPLRAAAG